MDRKIILWIVLGVIVLLVLFQTFYISSVGKAIAGKVASGVAGNAANVPSGGGMVGGC